MTTNRFSIIGRIGSINETKRVKSGREMARFSIMPLKPSPFTAADKQWFSITAWDDQIGFLLAAKQDKAIVEIVGTISSYEREDALTGRKTTELSLSCTIPMRYQRVEGAKVQRDIVPIFRLVGSLGDVQSARATQGGHEVASFGIGLRRKVSNGIRSRYAEDREDAQYRTEYINIEAWDGLLADATSYRQNKREMQYDYLAAGRLEMRSFTPKGSDRQITKLVLVATSLEIYTPDMSNDDRRSDGIAHRDDDNIRPDDDGVRL